MHTVKILLLSLQTYACGNWHPFKVQNPTGKMGPMTKERLVSLIDNTSSCKLIIWGGIMSNLRPSMVKGKNIPLHPSPSHPFPLGLTVLLWKVPCIMVILSLFVKMVCVRLALGIYLSAKFS